MEIKELAQSLAGHDKGRLYAVIGMEGDFLLVADGVHHTLETPKKKKRIHLQPIRRITERARAIGADVTDNEQLQEMIRVYVDRLKED